MKETTFKGIQAVAHLAVIFTAGLICAVLIKDYLIFPPTTPEKRSAVERTTRNGNTAISLGDEIRPGTNLTFSGIDWEKNGQTLA